MYFTCEIKANNVFVFKNQCIYLLKTFLIEKWEKTFKKSSLLIDDSNFDIGNKNKNFENF